MRHRNTNLIVLSASLALAPAGRAQPDGPLQQETPMPEHHLTWRSTNPEDIALEVERQSRARLAYEPTPLAGPADASFLFKVEDFGAVGDGRHDDGPAIRQAVAAASQRGAGSVVRFEPKTYHCALYTGHHAHIALEGANGIAIDGNGATVVASPPNTFVHLQDCEGVVVRGFVFDYTLPLHTQGTIEAVDADKGWLDVRLHRGYPFAGDFPYPGHLYTVGAWGVVVDPHRRHRKWGVGDHTFIEAFEAVQGQPDLYRVTPTRKYQVQLKQFAPGDRFVVNVRYRWPETSPAGGTSHNIMVQRSRNCRIEGITTYMAQAMNSAFVHNTGPITVRGMRITFKPGTDHLVSAYRDGMHCKFNRGPLIVEHCAFEGMMDDSINISTMGQFAEAAFSPRSFALSDVFRPGDAVMAFDPGTGKALAVTRVAQTDDFQQEFPRLCLFMHPPYRTGHGRTTLEIPLTIPPTGTVGVRFGFGMHPDARQSDGVTFRIGVDGEDLRHEHCTHNVFHAKEEWLDLSAYAGRDIRLHLAVDPGPARTAPSTGPSGPGSISWPETPCATSSATGRQAR